MAQHNNPGQDPDGVRFSESAKEQVIQHIISIKKLMPFLIDLSSKQRRRKAEMSERRRPFAQKALEYAKNESRPVPRSIDLHKMELDLDTYLKLRQVQRELRKLDEMIRDTIALTGSDTYSTACKIYNAYGLARGADIPGIDSIYNDLNRHFKRGNYKETGGTDDALNDIPEETAQ